VINLKEIKNIPVKVVAEILGVSQQFIRVGLQQKTLPIGSAVKISSKWSYHISYELLKNYIGEEKLLKYK
jgi:hypothetical protein